MENPGLFFGTVLLAFGLLLTFLSKKRWYIDWVKERLPMDETKLVRGERSSAIVLVMLGITQIIRSI